MRFNTQATTLADAATYLTERATQLLKFGVDLTSLERVGDEAVVARFSAWDCSWADVGLRDQVASLVDQPFAGIYLLDQFRGNNRYPKIMREVGLPILTHEDCGLQPYLKYRNFPYIMFSESSAYKCVAGFYGDRQAQRSKVWYMRHIDEGLAVLRYLHRNKLPEPAASAFCLHPMVQNDADLLTNWRKLGSSADAIVLAMEYRATANAALAHHKLPHASAIKLSVLSEVNDMLVADKVQNLSDFVVHHKGTHPRSAELARYFKLWLDRLEIDATTYQTWVVRLHRPRQLLQDFLATLA